MACAWHACSIFFTGGPGALSQKRCLSWCHSLITSPVLPQPLPSCPLTWPLAPAPCPPAPAPALTPATAHVPLSIPYICPPLCPLHLSPTLPFASVPAPCIYRILCRVRFSYCASCAGNTTCRCFANDTTTAEDNYDAVAAFFRGMTRATLH